MGGYTPHVHPPDLKMDKTQDRKNFYGSLAWQKLRSKVKAHWRRSNLPCGLCHGKLDWATKGAVVVDHIKPRRTHPGLAMSPLNLMCAHKSPCHDKMKKIQELNSGKKKIGIDGWPIEP